MKTKKIVGGLKLSEALNQFSEWGSSRYAIRTVHTYSGLIGRFISFSGDKYINEINIINITSYFMHLKTKDYAESSLAYMMISLRQFFKFLFLRHLIDWDYQLISIPKYVSKSYIPAEPKDAKAIIDNMRGDNFKSLRDKLIISFLYSSGVRVSELCSLQLSDLLLDQKYGNIISKKNRQPRMVFWDDATDQLLKKYLPERRLWANSDYLVISVACQNKGKKMTTRSVQRLVSTHRQPDSNITPHSFRHGLGMRAVKSKIHPRYIQKILGHKNINSSQIYLDVHDIDVVEAYNQISKQS